MFDRFFSSRFFYTASDVVVPFLSWTLITFPVWMSPFHPAIVAYFIIAFDLYFLYKSSFTAYYASITYKKLLMYHKENFVEKLKKVKESKDIHHFLFVLTYKEPLYKLEQTIEKIVQNDYPYKTINLVLAFEEREDRQARDEKAAALKEKYGYYFKDIISTHHQLVAGEIPGKASNQTHAAKMVDHYVAEKGWDREKVLITISDADSNFPSNYFSYLTYEFLQDSERKFHFYWAPVLLYNNFWQLPFFGRMQATLSSILRLAFLSQTDQLIQISTYSTNLWLLKSVGFWDVDIIPEDWHIYFQAFFTHGAKVKTIPLYTVINGDAVYSGSMKKTFFSRYDQEKRWAWGVTDTGYAIKKFFTTPHIPARVKLKKILYLTESHLLWPTSFFILTISASIPPFINPVFKRTVLGFLLPQLTGFILTLATSMVIIYIYLDIKMRQELKIQTKLWNMPILLIQWYLLPVVSFVLSSLPALEAHTRLLIGKKITYKVTEKV